MPKNSGAKIGISQSGGNAKKVIRDKRWLYKITISLLIHNLLLENLLSNFKVCFYLDEEEISSRLKELKLKEV
ncbi:MAG: hypothetical protein Q4E41_05990 [Bacteroidales bacterium]|nr:hypothetical protein [Bacteroidales bacterium]